MSHRLKKNANILMLMKNASKKTNNDIIKKADKELVNTLCECSLNVLNGNIKLTPTQKKRLHRHCATLRCLVDKKTSLNKKKKALQTGGFLPAVLGILAPILSKLLS